MKKQMQKFKYLFNQVITYLPKRIAWLHEKFKQTTEQEIENVAEQPKNIYELFFDWITEITLYGLIIMFILASLFIWTGWLKIISLPFSFGMVRWMWLDMVSKTSKAIRLR